LKKALVDLDRILELGEDLFVRQKRGFVRVRVGLWQGAVDDLESLTREDKKGGFFNSLGVAKMKLKRLTEALKEFDIAIKKDGKMATYHMNRGYALEKLNRGNDAYQAYTECLELDSKLSSAWLLRALLSKRLENYRGMKNDLENYLALEPNGSRSQEFRDAVRVLKEKGY